MAEKAEPKVAEIRNAAWEIRIGHLGYTMGPPAPAEGGSSEAASCKYGSAVARPIHVVAKWAERWDRTTADHGAGRCAIMPRETWATGLIVAVLALAACSTLSPAEQRRNTVLWTAAEDCRRSFATIQPDRIDVFGRLAFSYYVDAERQPFLTCYRETAAARLGTTPEAIGAQDGTAWATR
jgi:hypothetical protein